MIEAIMIFTSQFAMVFALGFQQMNVTGGHYFLAAIGSLVLGILAWVNVSIISSNNIDGLLGIVFWGYILAGPLAIMSSMYLHRKYIKPKTSTQS